MPVVKHKCKTPEEYLASWMRMMPISCDKFTGTLCRKEEEALCKRRDHFLGDKAHVATARNSHTQAFLESLSAGY